MRSHYDVIVAGGSIAGLLCAREVASAGHSVLVMEREHEIGTPEHCGGLVSSYGLGELGVEVPPGPMPAHMADRARITAPDGRSITVDATRQKVLCIDRRALDKQAAHQAQRAGATIMVKTSLKSVTGSIVRTTAGGEAGCRVAVDARGLASPVQKERTGFMPSAQYEVYADWIADGTVEVMPDQARYPGFFAWVIPSGRGRGRVGVAGRGINAPCALESLLTARGDGHSIIRRILAPIWIKGPIRRFVDGGAIIVGDAAGQAKPTTAGGIFSSGMGGILAGRAISQHLDAGNDNAVEIAESYQRRWSDMFGREFERQLLARRVFERMDNRAINDLIGAVSPETLQKISDNDDFDFHMGSIVRLLSVGGMIRAARGILGSEIRRLLG